MREKHRTNPGSRNPLKDQGDEDHMNTTITLPLQSGAALHVPHDVATRILLPALTGAEQPTSKPAAEKLEWSHTLCDGERVDFDAAEKAIAALGEGWRLPTRMELESILDLTRHDPAIDTKRFPDTKSTYYWTSTPCAWNASAVWVVDFGLGYASVNHRYNAACVRAVRVAPAGQ
ncbi:MAG: DUF1566 domain-containing protein [Pseudomonadota bacterium]